MINTNKVQLKGNVGNTIKVNIVNDKNMLKFSLATNRSYKNKDEVWVKETTWHNITAWGDLAEYGKHIKSGSFVSVDGRIRNSQWEKDGQIHYYTEIVADDISIINPIKLGQNYEPTPVSNNIPDVSIEEDPLADVFDNQVKVPD